MVNALEVYPCIEHLTLRFVNVSWLSEEQYNLDFRANFSWRNLLRVLPHLLCFHLCLDGNWCRATFIAAYFMIWSTVKAGAGLTFSWIYTNKQTAPEILSPPHVSVPPIPLLVKGSSVCWSVLQASSVLTYQAPRPNKLQLVDSYPK